MVINCILLHEYTICKRDKETDSNEKYRDSYKQIPGMILTFQL